MNHSRWRQLLLSLFALGMWGCSDDTNTPEDLGIVDGPQPALESGVDGEPVDLPKSEGPAPDLAPDGPKKPAHWDYLTHSTEQRVEHTATLLQDGTVLIAGGWNRLGKVNTRLATASIFGPTSGGTTPTGSMAIARSAHTANRLPDGRVLVVGGFGTDLKPTKEVEIYDPKAKTWQKGPALTVALSSHRAVTLHNGDILVVGGFDGFKPLAGVMIYQAAQGTWKLPTVTLNHKRAGHSATVLSTGKVLIAGGYDGEQKIYLDSLELYDPTTGTFALLTTKLKSKRTAHTATLLKDGKVLLIGGVCGTGCAMTSNELYDPATNTSQSVTHAGDPPNFHASVRLLDGRVLVTGDFTKSDATKTVAYDPTGGGSWTPLPDMNYGRHKHTATLLEDGSVLVVGGKNGTWEPVMEQLERFYP